MGRPADWDAIVTQLRQGADDLVWAELRRFLEGYMNRLGMGEADEARVNDILHAILARLIKFRTEGRLEKLAYIRAYCTRIAIRQLRADALKRNQRPQQPQWKLTTVKDPGPDPSDNLAERELRSEVRAAMDALPESQREILQLSVADGMTPAQICKSLKKRGQARSVDAVAGLLKRARRSVRNALSRKALGIASQD